MSSNTVQAVDPNHLYK